MLAKFFEIVSWKNHATFEKWCLRAATGDLTENQLGELDKHVAKCARCRRSLEDATQAVLEAVPAFWEKPAISVLTPDDMRARFLRRLDETKYGREAAVSPRFEVELPLGDGSRDMPAAHGTARPAVKNWKQAFPVRAAAWALAAIIAISLLSGGYYVGRKSKSGSPQTNQVAQVYSLGELPSPIGTEKTLGRLESQLKDLQRESAEARKAKMDLEAKLASSIDKLTLLEQTHAQESQRTSLEAQETRIEMELLKKDNESLRRQVAQTEALLASQQQRAQEFETQLEVAKNAIREDNEMHLAKGKLGDLVVARNLHIVDVYDADGAGKRKPSFGRVFYVEGKSLLFYAYDLPDPHKLNANVVFRVWGGRTGTKEVTHSLGILRNEDSAQGLWTMTFDDPTVLAQINSVYVTAETGNKHDAVPHGKKVLYAYFGNPANHQ
jgi:hypothetical protein